MLPTIGMYGIFSFKSPFNTDDFMVPMKVIAIRSFRDMASENIDVLKMVYLKDGLTEDDYKRDKENDENIVIFVDNSNTYHRISTFYILNTPISDGEIFSNVYVGFPLGYIPKGYNLETLLNEMKDLLLKNLGIKTTPKVIDSARDVVYDKSKVTEFNQRVTVNRNNRGYIPYAERIKQLEEQLVVARKEKEDLMKFMSARYNDIVIPENRPNAEDLKTYTKKIRIEVKSKDLTTQAVLSSFKFLIYNSYNQDPSTVYLTRSSMYENDINRFSIVLNNVNGTMTLTKGEYNTTTILPRMFSRSDCTKFMSNLSTIEITLDKPINIRGYSFSPHDGNTLFSKTWQVTLYNSDDAIISCIKDNVIEDPDENVEKKDITLRVQVTPDTPLT